MPGGINIFLKPKKLSKKAKSEDSLMKMAARDLLKAIQNNDEDQMADIMSAMKEFPSEEGEEDN